jgi:hypothetical protein
MEKINDDSDLLPERDGVGENASPAEGPLKLEEPALPKRRLIGSMKGLYTVPDDIKTMFAEEIEEMFYGYRAQHKFDDIEEFVAGQRSQELKAKS